MPQIRAWPQAILLKRLGVFCKSDRGCKRSFRLSQWFHKGLRGPHGGRDLHQLPARGPAWARLLHAQLQAEGIEAWYDAQVGAGQDWRIATAKALRSQPDFRAAVFFERRPVHDIAKELAAAVYEKKLIVPVRLENIAPDGAFLYELASRNWINAYENTEARLAELAKGLAQMVRSGTRDESVLPFDRSDDGRTPLPRKRPRKPVRSSPQR